LGGEMEIIIFFHCFHSQQNVTDPAGCNNNTNQGLLSPYFPFRQENEKKEMRPNMSSQRIKN
jgi:hypothetical protein